MGRISQASYAFGVDPRRKERYSLRQSRYDALAQDVSDLAGDAARAGDRLRLLIVGCAGGSELRHLRGKPHFDQIIVSGANLDDKNFVDIEQYTEVFIGDIRMGYPEIDSDRYDVVICEQVLEHLDRLDVPIATLERVLQPGGKLIVGVPIFPPPFHLVRRHVVPIVDALLSRRKTRGHVQAFSLSSFIAEMRQYSGLKLREVRGFRIVSGGPLRRLENYRWWWKLNRRLGDFMPAACIEIQAIMEKPRNPPQPNRGTGEQFRCSLFRRLIIDRARRSSCHQKPIHGSPLTPTHFCHKSATSLLFEWNVCPGRCATLFSAFIDQVMCAAAGGI